MSEFPTFLNQKSPEFHAFDTEVFANVWYFGAILRAFLLRDDNGVLDFGFGDDERVGKVPTLEEFLPVEILLKVWYRVNLADEGKLFHAWILKEIGIMRRELYDYGIIEFLLEFEPCFAHRNHPLTLKHPIKLFPKGRKAVAIVMIEDVRQRVGIENVNQGLPPSRTRCSNLGRFRTLTFKYSATVSAVILL